MNGEFRDKLRRICQSVKSSAKLYGIDKTKKPKNRGGIIFELVLFERRNTGWIRLVIRVIQKFFTFDLVQLPFWRKCYFMNIIQILYPIKMISTEMKYEPTQQDG